MNRKFIFHKKAIALSEGWKNGQNRCFCGWKNGQNKYFCSWKNGQNMIKRKIIRKLETFYKSTENAMLITGARQVGKTYAIRQFGKSNFSCFVEFNFLENLEARRIFSETRNVEEFLLRITALATVNLQKHDTLIFFDEVQECPELVTMLKFLVEEGSYRYILSGSLSGVELKDIRSVPVGFLTIEEMFPLDFEEFAKAVNLSDEVWDYLKKSYNERTKVDDVIHRRILQIFRMYLSVGGMPAVVDDYLKSNNLKSYSNVQKGILQTYKKDIAKYDYKEKLLLNDIFDLIPSELNAKNKRFILKNMNENAKFSRFENSFLWLRDAGVALPVFNVEEPKVPLLLSKSRNLFKLFSSDVGLLVCQYGPTAQLAVTLEDANLNNGALYENVVAQELRAHGFRLFYFNSKKQGELDFVVECNNHVLPIEVKSGKDYKRHSALSNVLGSSQYNIPHAIVFSNGNLECVGSVDYLPIYMVSFLQIEETPEVQMPNNFSDITLPSI